MTYLRMIKLALSTLLILASTANAARITVEDIGLSTPESVEYYGADDIYLVTNINGSPFEKDDNGFISKVSPTGEMIDLKWIDGSHSETLLNAPKGLAISNNRLFVADLDQVHIFSLPSGKQVSSVTIGDTLFLNGITPAADGSVYVSDSGFIPGFKEGGSDAVYQVFADGSYSLVIKDTKLRTPNGLYTDGVDLLIGSSRSQNIFRLKPNGHLSKTATPSGMDGMLLLPNGDFLFSSWKDKAVYRMGRDGESRVIGADLKSPADMGYDSKRNRALVPIFLENKLVFLSL